MCVCEASIVVAGVEYENEFTRILTLKATVFVQYLEVRRPPFITSRTNGKETKPQVYDVLILNV